VWVAAIPPEMVAGAAAIVDAAPYVTGAAATVEIAGAAATMEVAGAAETEKPAEVPENAEVTDAVGAA